ncbi:unnamed protein product [Owenia fusiformis]|nr:unnamed protein product [Owenia fusiformis]
MMRTIVALCMLAVVLVQAQDSGTIAYKYTIPGMRINRGKTEEDALNEVKAFLDWMVERNPGILSGYQDATLIPKRRVFDATFVLMSYLDISGELLRQELEEYKALVPNKFVAIDGRTVRTPKKGEEVNVYGDPHVTFEFRNRTFCFETEEPLNETLELYTATELGIKLNIDFRSVKPNSANDEMWIHDVGILSANVNVTVTKNNISVVNNTDGTQKSLAWNSNDSIEVSNNYVSVHGQQMLYLKYADDNADVEDVEIGVFRTTSGSLDVTFSNTDDVVTDGFVRSVISQIGNVSVDPNQPDVLNMAPVWNGTKMIEAHRYEEKCWKITHGAHQLFQNAEDWQKFVRQCLLCES